MSIGVKLQNVKILLLVPGSEAAAQCSTCTCSGCYRNSYGIQSHHCSLSQGYLAGAFTTRLSLQYARPRLPLDDAASPPRTKYIYMPSGSPSYIDQCLTFMAFTVSQLQCVAVSNQQNKSFQQQHVWSVPFVRDACMLLRFYRQCCVRALTKQAN